MDQQEKEIIDDVFKKIEAIRHRSVDRDFTADAFIRARMEEHPEAAYYLVQTVVMQEVALHLALDRLEGRRTTAHQPAPANGLGSFLDRVTGMLGISRWRRTLRYVAGARSGFISGATETAMGVAGGVALGQLLSSALGTSGASAAEPAAAAAAELGGPVGGGEDHDDDSLFDDDDF